MLSGTLERIHIDAEVLSSAIFSIPHQKAEPDHSMNDHNYCNCRLPVTEFYHNTSLPFPASTLQRQCNTETDTAHTEDDTLQLNIIETEIVCSEFMDLVITDIHKNRDPEYSHDTSASGKNTDSTLGINTESRDAVPQPDHTSNDVTNITVKDINDDAQCAPGINRENVKGANDSKLEVPKIAVDITAGLNTIQGINSENSSNESSSFEGFTSGDLKSAHIADMNAMGINCTTSSSESSEFEGFTSGDLRSLRNSNAGSSIEMSPDDFDYDDAVADSLDTISYIENIVTPLLPHDPSSEGNNPEHILPDIRKLWENDAKSNKEASWLHAELFFVLVSMWLPQQHMVSIWTPHGIHVETMWCPVETT